MNKLLKASLAGAAGIALLLGGTGTFALWNATATISAPTVSSGTLALIAGACTFTPAITTWVPGDTRTCTSTVKIVSTGDNLKATLSVDKSSITSSGTGGTALQNALLVTMAVSSPPSGVACTAATVGTSGGTCEITTGGTYDVPVVVTVAFPSGTAQPTGDNTTQSGTVNLSSLKFLIAQHL